jgi:hypothetical protein
MVNDDTERLPWEIHRIIVEPGETDARIDELAIAVEQIRRAVVQMADAIALARRTLKTARMKDALSARLSRRRAPSRGAQ